MPLPFRPQVQTLELLLNSIASHPALFLGAGALFVSLVAVVFWALPAPDRFKALTLILTRRAYK